MNTAFIIRLARLACVVSIVLAASNVQAQSISSEPLPPPTGLPNISSTASGGINAPPSPRATPLALPAIDRPVMPVAPRIPNTESPREPVAVSGSMLGHSVPGVPDVAPPGAPNKPITHHTSAAAAALAKAKPPKINAIRSTKPKPSIKNTSQKMNGAHPTESSSN